MPAKSSKHHDLDSYLVKRPVRASVQRTLAFATGMRLFLTSKSSGRRHVVWIDGVTRTLRRSSFQMLAELAVARKLTITGYLYTDDCCTTKPNPDYFAKLADRVREELGDNSFVDTGHKSYRLPFEPKDIEVCPGILEMRELDKEVLTKLQTILSL